MLGITASYFLQNYFLFNDRIRISGISIIGGLFNTAWFILDLPGSSIRYGIDGSIRLCFSVFIGELIGGVIGWLYVRMIENRSKKKRS